MKIKVIKKNGKSYLLLPDSFSKFEELELFKLKEGFWLLSIPLEQASRAAGQEKTELTEAEREILHKLLQIKFADRTPSKIEKILSVSEKEIVRNLIKKGFIQVFYGGKYQKTGVYNITNDVYALLSKPAPQPEKQAEEHKQPSYSELTKNGWIIIANPEDAEQFSAEIKRLGVASSIKGMRAFDGKFYVATTKFFQSATERIKAALAKKKEMTAGEIAAASALELEAVMVVLHLLGESGEIIEKKRGVFSLA